MIKSLVLLVTYQCNARCDYCECGPGVRNKLSGDDIVRYIDGAKALGTVRQVIFTGGEPTLLGDDLLRAIAHATSAGMITRVVTNGWWARTPEAADEHVGRLIAHGLTEINISVDDLHQRWVPLERVKNAFLACYRRRFKCLIAHKETKCSTITKTFLETYFGVGLVDYRAGQIYTTDEECRLISTGGVVPVGRPSQIIIPEDLTYGGFQGNCQSVLKDVVVGADHHLLPCCGIVTKNLPELTLADLRSTPMIDAIEEANNDAILNWLTLEGPAAIGRFVSAQEPTVRFASRYVNACHFCNELFTRADARTVLHRYIDNAKERISLLRTFLERIRRDEELLPIFTRS
jgi:hypothetical protein